MLGVRPADCGAGQLTYLLPFALGQNDFDVFITSPAAAAAQASWPKPHVHSRHSA